MNAYDFWADMPPASKASLIIDGKTFHPKRILLDLQSCSTIKQISDLFYEKFASEYFVFESTRALTHWTVMLQEYAEEVPEGVWIVFQNWEHLLAMSRERGVEWAALTARSASHGEGGYFLHLSFVGSETSARLIRDYLLARWPQGG